NCLGSAARCTRRQPMPTDNTYDWMPESTNVEDRRNQPPDYWPLASKYGRQGIETLADLDRVIDFSRRGSSEPQPQPARAYHLDPEHESFGDTVQLLAKAGTLLPVAQLLGWVEPHHGFLDPWHPLSQHFHSIDFDPFAGNAAGNANALNNGE